MITFHNLLTLYGVNAENVRLVRHGNREIPVLETFRNDIHHLEIYQTYQKDNKYGKASTIAVFAPHYHTTALFLGLWDIKGCIPNSEFTEKHLQEIKSHNFPLRWMQDHVRYDLKRNTILEDLSERLVIEWGPATVSWVQRKDKEVVEIKGKHSIGDFKNFSEVELNFYELKKLVRNPDSNPTWVSSLSSVNGIYMIRDEESGKIYVGSAYGDRGIYGRWMNYAHDGHGGNLQLQNLDPAKFQFSILEIMPSTASQEHVIECENRWKNKLGTRIFGLNTN